MTTLLQGIVDGLGGGFAGLPADALTGAVATAGLFALFGVMAVRRARTDGSDGGAGGCGGGGCDTCEHGGANCGGCSLFDDPTETTRSGGVEAES